MNNRKNVLPPAEKPAAGTALTSQEDGISKAVKEKYDQHNRDISSKTVFGNAVLCAQFLRDNIIWYVYGRSTGERWKNKGKDVPDKRGSVIR